MKLATFTSPNGLKIRVNRAGGLRLSGPVVAAATVPERRRELIDRCFAVPILRSLRLPARATDTVLLTFEHGRARLSETLDALAAAMRAPVPGTLPLANDDAVFSLVAPGRALDIYRVGQRLTFWHFEQPDPGSYRCFHPFLASRRVREQILEELGTLAGIDEETGSSLRGGYLLLRGRAQKVTPAHLLDVLEPMLSRAAPLWSEPPSELTVNRVLTTANLAIAPVADFVFPPLGIANLALVTSINRPTLRRAWSALRRGTFNLSVLHGSMGLLSFVTYEFLSEGVMHSLLDYWPDVVEKQRRQSERRFLSRFRRSPRQVWVERGGAQTEVNLWDLQPDEPIILRPGDTVPGDGVVESGEGGVEESWISGAPGVVAKRAGDALFASSRMVEGELRMQMEAIGEHTAAARLANWYAHAFAQPHHSMSAARFAERTATPALLLSIAAFRRGGLHLAKTVARPDYQTGPALAAELGELAVTLQSGGLGMLIAKPESMLEVAAADCFVIDDSVISWAPGPPAEQTVGERLRQLGVQEVVLISHRPSDEIARLAEELGADLFLGRQSAVEKTSFIAQRQFFGRKIVYFGDVTGPDAPVAKRADVAVAVAAPSCDAFPDAPILFRQPDLEKCVLLRLMGLASVEHQKAGRHTALAVNLACVAGALFLQFPTMAVVVLTNLGTFASFWRARRLLRAAERQ